MRICKIFLLFFLTFASLNLRAEQPSDIISAMQMVRDNYKPGENPASFVRFFAEKLIDTPFEPVSQKDTLCLPVIRLDAFDEMTFINTVAALAKTATEAGMLRDDDLAENFESMSFRKGKADGFTSKLLYGADWATDNKSRGNISELTEDFSTLFKTKSLEYITRNRELYPVLADSAAFERQKMMEFGFRTHKIPHLKRESTDWKEISQEMKDGDILMLLTPEDNRDIFEIGIVARDDDGFHFIHASPRDGKVVKEAEPLGRYIKRHSKETYGYRWFRIK